MSEDKKTGKLFLKDIHISGSAGDGMRISNVPFAHLEGVRIIDSAQSGMVFEGAGHAPISLGEHLGIPEDTPVELLLEVLREVNGVSRERRDEVVERSRIAPFLVGKGISLVAFAANLATIGANPIILKLLAGS